MNALLLRPMKTQFAVTKSNELTILSCCPQLSGRGPHSAAWVQSTCKSWQGPQDAISLTKPYSWIPPHPSVSLQHAAKIRNNWDEVGGSRIWSSCSYHLWRVGSGNSSCSYPQCFLFMELFFCILCIPNGPEHVLGISCSVGEHESNV